MRILVTGSSGFLGHAIREYLINEGYETYGTTRSRPPEDAWEFQFDIIRDSCDIAFNNIQFDVIIHTIGLVDDGASFKALQQVNVIGTQKILDYAKRSNCKHFIQLSSVSVYGISTLGQNRTEDSVKIRPHSIVSKYARSKAQAELAVMKSGLPFTILRLPLMIGKGDKMVSIKLVELLRKREINYVGKGKKLISIMPVNNLCNLLSILVKKPAINQSLHCPSYHISLNTFVKVHSSLVNLPVQIKKSSLLLLLRKPSNIEKILLTFSWRGAHFKDNLVRELLPEYEDSITWEDSIQEALEKQPLPTNPPYCFVHTNTQ